MNVRLKYDMHFPAAVYYNDQLRMNNYSLRLWMTTNSENALDQNVAFERIKYFVYTQMDSTVFINQDLKEQCVKLAQAGVNVTTMPGEPVDQLVGIMLYYKLNAITEDRMIIVETELASVHGENMTYIHSDFENTTGYVQPDWWTSADLTHNDLVIEDTDKVLSIPNANVWRDLDLVWAESTVDDATGNIVIVDFKKNNDTE